MTGKITVYISNVVSSMETRKNQTRIQDVLAGKKIEFEVVDVSASKDELAKMREIVGNEHACPPQIVNGTVYCGDYEQFDDAVECGTLKEFLKL
ncbi:SH3 domain-binding glutamic acid-rich-like protein 3 [Physella acuta]|uniref:SH3 domain-binding glutamic acid-rich-like protein 3 n=1 Tax=Physella acuta TaxID=109671 RepID=UPI0027DBC537|nr:SH3 domain-binding glutamic acid-rich-like protein 3 [Physella acuta]